MVKVKMCGWEQLLPSARDTGLGEPGQTAERAPGTEIRVFTGLGDHATNDENRVPVGEHGRTRISSIEVIEGDTLTDAEVEIFVIRRIGVAAILPTVDDSNHAASVFVLEPGWIEISIFVTDAYNIKLSGAEQDRHGVLRAATRER